MTTPDLLNIIGLALDGSAALLLLATAPIPQRNMHFKDVEEINQDFVKDRRTRVVHYIGFALLPCGFLLQLAAQLAR